MCLNTLPRWLWTFAGRHLFSVSSASDTPFPHPFHTLSMVQPILCVCVSPCSHLMGFINSVVWDVPVGKRKETNNYLFLLILLLVLSVGLKAIFERERQKIARLEVVLHDCTATPLSIRLFCIINSASHLSTTVTVRKFWFAPSILYSAISLSRLQYESCCHSEKLIRADCLLICYKSVGWELLSPVSLIVWKTHTEGWFQYAVNVFGCEMRMNKWELQGFFSPKATLSIL